MNKVCGCKNAMTYAQVHERAFHLAKVMIGDDECPASILAIGSALTCLAGDLSIRALDGPRNTISYIFDRMALQAALEQISDEIGESRKKSKQYIQNIKDLEKLHEETLEAKGKLK